MAENVEIIVKATGAKEAGEQFKGLADAADKSAGSVKKSADSVDYLRGIYNSFIGLVAGYSVFELAKGYQSLSDTFTGVINRLKLVSSSAAELAATEQKLLDVANSTRADFASTADLYSKLAANTAQLGIDQKDLIPTITTVNQLIAISGASAEESRAGLLQFSQALASNRFQGDELRSVLENLPALGKAIAQGLGTTTAGLRVMGEQGQLTTKLVLGALEKSAPEIKKQFASITPTISGAFQVLKNNLLQMVGIFDQTKGVSGAVATAILFLANNIGTLAKVLGLAVAGVVAFYTAMAVQSAINIFLAGINAIIARITAANIVLGYAGTQLGFFRSALLFLTTPLAAVRAAVASLWAVVAANPFTIIVTAIGLAVAAAYLFGDAIKVNTSGSITLWGALAGSVTYVWTLLKQLWGFIGGYLGPIFTSVGNLAVTIFTAIYTKIKQVIDYLATFIPALAGVSAKLDGFGKDWIKAMEEASKASGGLGDSLKGLGGNTQAAVGAAGALKTATQDLGAAVEGTKTAIGDYSDAVTFMASTETTAEQAAEALRKTQERARKVIEDYAAATKAAAAETQRLALTTRNAFGEMITVTDEWARRSGAAFNAVKDGASSTATAVDNSMEQIVASAEKASAAIQSTASNITSQSTYLNDSATVKMAFESQGGDWSQIGNALLVMNNMYGHPGGDTAVQNLWNILDKQPKAAAHSFVQNYAYVNNAFAGQGLPTFATGGDFAVGGHGGTDSQLVQFMASPDENVLVETPAQRRARLASQEGNSGGGNVIVNMNVSTPDANSFRRSKSQTYLALRAKLSGATR